MRWIDNLIKNCGHSMSPLFKEKLETTIPEKGLYLIGQTAFNPHTEELFYWVKVGKTKNVKSRFSSYQTDNPCIYYIDWFETSKLSLEAYCIASLRCFGLDTHRDEWVSVDRETYLNICNKGFKEIKNIVYALTGKILFGAAPTKLESTHVKVIRKKIELKKKEINKNIVIENLVEAMSSLPRASNEYQEMFRFVTNLLSD